MIPKIANILLCMYGFGRYFPGAHSQGCIN